MTIRPDWCQKHDFDDADDFLPPKDEDDSSDLHLADFDGASFERRDEPEKVGKRGIYLHDVGQAIDREDVTELLQQLAATTVRLRLVDSVEIT